MKTFQYRIKTDIAEANGTIQGKNKKDAEALLKEQFLTEYRTGKKAEIKNTAKLESLELTELDNG